MLSKKVVALMLVLCLLAGCAAPGGPSAPESVSPPAESPAPESPVPEKPTVIPQEDPERPGNLAGTQGYYTPGNRLTLYAMEPESGTLRVVRENDFWNGREVESVSPDGRWLLLSSWDGAPGRRVVALSLYDVERDLLVNLTRTIEEPYSNWTADHWFPGMSTYRFTSNNTFYYQDLCGCGSEEQPHLHRYDVGEDGQVAASLLELECPPREPGWDSCILLPEEGKILGSLWTGEDTREWLTWELDSGKLLSRVPGENGGMNGWYDHGAFYYIDEEWEQETFRLMAYHIDTDTAETLASGAIPKTPGREDEPIDGRGVQERVRVEGMEDGKILLRSSGEEYGYTAPALYHEFLWDPAAGGDIRFGEPISAPTFPVEEVRGYTPVFVTGPDGEGLYLPVPQDMAEYYRENGGRPYPIATLPTGELLFLAAEPGNTLPQEDPEHLGQLAGEEGTTSGTHRLTLYRFTPETGQTVMVREPGFWNGLTLEDVSPSGNRLLLATRTGAEGKRRAALAVYDIGENRLTNLANPGDIPGDGQQGKHWFPGDYRYRFLDEDTFLYQGICYDRDSPGRCFLPRYLITSYGMDQHHMRVDHPRLTDYDTVKPCVYLPEEGTILCDLPLADDGDGHLERFVWRVGLSNQEGNGDILSQQPTEDAPPLQNYQTQPQEPPAGLPLPKRMGPLWPLAALPTGETLFLAR